LSGGGNVPPGEKEDLCTKKALQERGGIEDVGRGVDFFRLHILNLASKWVPRSKGRRGNLMKKGFNVEEFWTATMEVHGELPGFEK